MKVEEIRPVVPESEWWVITLSSKEVGMLESVLDDAMCFDRVQDNREVYGFVVDLWGELHAGLES